MKLIIKKRTVVKLFEALGFKTAKTWDETRLLNKVNQLPELVKESEIAVKSPKMKRILKKILKANKVVFKAEEEPERPSEEEETVSKERETEMSSKTKKKKKEVTKKKETKKKEAKTKAEKDAFGRRLESQGAKIDEHLDKKGKTVEQLAKDCKLSVGRVSNHVRDFVAQGFLKKDKDGKYALTGKTK